MDLNGSFARSLDPRLLRQYRALFGYLKRIGNTPLLEVPGPRSGARVFAKAEFLGGSKTVKDRVALALIYRMLATTPPEKRRRVLEYSGGSLSNALAELCHDLGFPLTIVMPASTDSGVLDALRRRSVEVVLTPAEEAFWGVIQRTRQLAADHPDWAFLYQHENEANLWVHRETTGREIVEQLPPEVRARPCSWVASVGTGGTLVGVYSAMKAVLPRVRLFLNSPAELPVGTDEPPNALPRFLGSGGFGLGRRQPFLKAVEGDLAGHLHVPYGDALKAVRELHRRTGYWVGSSAAANWVAACRIAEQAEPGQAVVTVFPCAAPEFERKLLYTPA